MGSQSHQPPGHSESESFVSEDSLYDAALSGLAILSAIGLVILMTFWVSLPLPDWGTICERVHLQICRGRSRATHIRQSGETRELGGSRTAPTPSGLYESTLP